MKAKLIFPVAWGLSVIAIVAFVLTFQHYLALAQEAAKTDYSRELAALEDYARLLKTFDRDHDRILQAHEIGTLSGAQLDLDLNRDGEISVKDARLMMTRLSEKMGVAAEVTPKLWGEYAADQSLFELLDGNHDGKLTSADFEATFAPELVTQHTIRDNRSEQTLVLEELRLSWLRRFNTAHHTGSLIWRGQDQKREHFGGGARAKVSEKEGGRLYFGFLSDGRSPQELRLLANDGGLLYFQRSQVDVAPYSADSESDWYQTVVATAATDAEAWRKLALKLRGTNLDEEARWAAKAALIYRPDFTDLYGMLGVRMIEGKLVEVH